MKTTKMCLAAMAAFGLMTSGSMVMAQDAATEAPAAAAPAGPAAGVPTLAQTVALLPANANVTAAVSLAGFANPRSLLSYVPRAELQTMMKQQLDAEGGKHAPPTAAMELVGRMIFDTELSANFTGFAIGMYVNPADPSSQPQEAIVLTGPFKAAELGPKLASHGAAAGAAPGMAQVAGLMGNAYHLSLPRDGVLLVSENQTWVAGGGQNGLTSNQNFTRSWTSLGSNLPDAVVWADVALLRTAAAQQPMIAMFAGPLLQSNGLMVTIDPGDVPSGSIVASFNDAQSAQMGVMFFQQMIEMGKAQLPAMAGGDPAVGEQVAEALKQINKLRTTSDDRSARLTMAFDDLPSRDEARQKMMQAMQEAMSGNMPMGMPF